MLRSEVPRVCDVAAHRGALADALYVVRSTIFMFLTAVLFAYLLNPLVFLVQRRLPCAVGVARPVALLIVYVLLVGGAVLLAVLLVRR